MGTPLDRGFPAGAGRLMRTPYFVVDEKSLLRNLELLKKVEEEGPCRILLAQKALEHTPRSAKVLLAVVVLRSLPAFWERCCW